MHQFINLFCFNGWRLLYVLLILCGLIKRKWPVLGCCRSISLSGHTLVPSAPLWWLISPCFNISLLKIWHLRTPAHFMLNRFPSAKSAFLLGFIAAVSMDNQLMVGQCESLFVCNRIVNWLTGCDLSQVSNRFVCCGE